MRNLMYHFEFFVPILFVKYYLIFPDCSNMFLFSHQNRTQYAILILFGLYNEYFQGAHSLNRFGGARPVGEVSVHS
jgi:hypothetical protein